MTRYVYIGKERFPVPAQQDPVPAPEAPKKRRGRAKMKEALEANDETTTTTDDTGADAGA